jgi:hypothetical protein
MVVASYQGYYVWHFEIQYKAIEDVHMAISFY